MSSFYLRYRNHTQLGPSFQTASELEPKRDCPLQMRHIVFGLHSPPFSIAAIKLKLNLHVVFLLTGAHLLISANFLPLMGI